MKNPQLTLVLCLSLLTFVGLACSKKDEAPAPPPAAAPSSPAPVASTSTEISGDYAINGSNPDGTNYSGNLNITKRDEVYQFSWTSGGREYDGVGVRTDNTVAVAFTEGADGKGCGVVLYKIGTDGSLDGRSGYWGVNSSETERATRKSGSDLVGSYEVSGKNPEGQEYKGTLAVNKQGAGYDFQWDLGRALKGFGIKRGDKVAVGFGGAHCGFVSYEIQPDGSLNGQWGEPGSTVIGTEMAKKQ